MTNSLSPARSGIGDKLCSWVADESEMDPASIGQGYGGQDGLGSQQPVGEWHILVGVHAGLGAGMFLVVARGSGPQDVQPWAQGEAGRDDGRPTLRSFPN